MNKRNSYRLILIIMCILMMYSSASYSLANEKEKLTLMQDAFFKICELKEQNKNLNKNDINEITDKFILEKTIKRELDVVNIYSQKSEKKENTEKLSVFRSLDGDLKIEGVIYSIYNPSKDLNVIRMQYHNLEENNKYIRLEITTENIHNVDSVLNKLNPNILKSELYDDYKSSFNMAMSNEEFSKDKLKNQMKEVKSNNDKQLKVTKGTNESLLLSIDKSSNKLKSIYYDFGVKTEKYQDCLNMISKNDLDKKDVEYYNLSKNSNFANTLMIFRNSAMELRELFLKLN